MYALVLLLVSLFATYTAAATAPPFQITRTKIHQVHGGNTTIEFWVFDPDPLTNATQKCTYSWKTDSANYPTGQYAPCGGNTSFAWNMAKYTAVNNFVLGIEHNFIDPAVGPYPYNQVTNFGHGNVTEPAIWCMAVGGQAACEQRKNSTIMAPIYATIAKRR